MATIKADEIFLLNGEVSIKSRQDEAPGSYLKQSYWQFIQLDPA